MRRIKDKEAADLVANRTYCSSITIQAPGSIPHHAKEGVRSRTSSPSEQDLRACLSDMAAMQNIYRRKVIRSKTASTHPGGDSEDRPLDRQATDVRQWRPSAPGTERRTDEPVGISATPPEVRRAKGRNWYIPFRPPPRQLTSFGIWNGGALATAPSVSLSLDEPGPGLQSRRRTTTLRAPQPAIAHRHAHLRGQYHRGLHQCRALTCLTPTVAIVNANISRGGVPEGEKVRRFAQQNASNG